MILVRNDILPSLKNKLKKIFLIISCRKFEESIVDYLQKDLSLPRNLIFKHHLYFCRDCRTFFDEYKHTIKLIKESVEEISHIMKDPIENGKEKSNKNSPDKFKLWII